MKLWVDYTNWRGVRAWRQIHVLSIPRVGTYNTETEAIQTWVMDVAMADRDGMRRTLRLDHAHGFHVGDSHP